MIPRAIDDGGRKLVLRERAGVLELLAGSVVLLSSAALETEGAFGRLAAGDGSLGPRRVLIAGLGFGATVRGALDACGPDARVVVVEKMEAVERLVRGELAEIAGHPLDDARVRVIIGDAADAVSGAPGNFDAVLLDVDNGPHWASFRTNARLYTPAGLAAVRRALSPGGTFAVWSGYAADAFIPALRAAGFAPSIVPLHERGRVRARAYVGRAP
ncbi:MAG: MnmC family methyltransferase [Polyangiaceae bacterium]|nr:MnmC family methyltransferase [Polyangiaceae bacterium]